ncbi:Uncharacterised protein [Legionella steigerwaltii]|uniref:Uncharacterized protein n=1 Tax=Legionella steigerwaltii TaxID=460 RepID=A0A378LEY9_9GAMM|nr:hypothetical protein [Legionella steigerwaltii]KTD77793.1 hypothetical protein Lstg_1516 [Legionella steigerwaltii]STY24432.1 Uncharacterised protein [Legionella steigerwaltii]
MAMWQDAYSLKDWRTILKNCKQHDDPKAKKIIDKLSNLLEEYHNISKTSLKKIPKRQEKLAQIVKAAQEYKDYLGNQFISKEQEKTPESPISFGPWQVAPKKARKDTSLTGSIDPWVQGLQKRASKKINYLDKLAEYYQNAERKYVNKKSLLHTLHVRERSHGKKRFFSLSSGTLLEREDPAHRPIEFMLDDLATKRNTAEYPMNRAFYQWVESKTKVPFFLWLEKHPISTTTRDISENWIGSYKTKMGPVYYDSPDTVSVRITKKDGDAKLMGQKANSKDLLELNTNELDDFVLKIGCPQGATAFIWDAKDKNHFYTHVHEAGKYHHSTMTSGKKVRCAGMWLVEQGKITAIDNSSGHYKPTSLSFYKLIRFLHSKNLLASDVRIADLRRPAEPKAGHHFFGAVRDRYTSLKNYLEWAENLPEVKKYLTENDISPLNKQDQAEAQLMGKNS